MLSTELKSPVRSKADFVTRYAAGEFGNASPTWSKLDDWIDDNPAKVNALFHIRNRVAGGETFYNLGPFDLTRKWMELEEQGRADSFYISQMCPTEKTIFQGEVVQVEPHSGRCGLDLYYTTVAKPMRDALKESSKSVSGVVASMTLRHFLDANSHDWLMYLLDSYPYHVVEFTTFSTRWGTIPGYNTVFWEVRNY